MAPQPANAAEKWQTGEPGPPLNPCTVWRYMEAQLRPLGPDAVDKAFRSWCRWVVSGP